MISTTTATCPDWCQSDHSGKPWGGGTELHSKYFGDGHEKGDANVYVCVEISLKDGSIEGSEFGINVDEIDNPEDIEEVAKWFLEAAKFMREVRSHGK